MLGLDICLQPIISRLLGLYIPEIQIIILFFPPEVEIYELYTSCWRDVDASGLAYVVKDYSSQALLKGIVHWAACDPHNVQGACTYGGLIVSFDLISEKFGALMLPKCLLNNELPHDFVVSTMKESLCLLQTGNLAVFIMKEYGITDSWEKLYNFESIGFLSFYIRENGEILAAKSFDEEMDRLSLVSCDPKSNEIIDLGGQDICCFSAYAYVDSLFLIKDLNGSNGETRDF